MNKGNFSYTIDTLHNHPVVHLQYNPIVKRYKPMQISVAPYYGSNLYSWVYGKDELIYTDYSILKVKGFTGTYVLFPFPNRVRDNAYQWKGERRELIKDGIPVTTHHQFVFDQPFSYSKPEVFSDHISLQTSITIDKKTSYYSSFPFPCTLILEYNLYPDIISIHYTVKNDGNTLLPFGFGLHPHFERLSGDKQTELSAPVAVWMESDQKTLLPTGNLIPVAGKPYDITMPKPLSILSLDHVFMKKPGTNTTVIYYNTKPYNLKLCASNDFTHIVVYTGEKRALCVEYQTCSTDAHNLYAKGHTKESHLLTVEPGEKTSGYIRYDIQTKQRTG